MNDVSTAIAVIGCVVAVMTFYIGRQTAQRAEGKEAGSLAKDIEYIKDSMTRIENRLNDDVKHLEGRIDEISRQMTEVTGTAARAHESAKMEHNRLNEHLERNHGQAIMKSGEKAL